MELGAVQQTRRDQLLPSESRAASKLDKNVLVLTVILWVAQWGILVSRSAAIGQLGGPKGVGIRLATAALGGLSCWCIHWLLRRSRTAAFKGLILSIAIAVPLSLFLGLINEGGWLFWTNYYRSLYGVTPELVAAGNCLDSKSPCHTFVVESIFTASAFIWVYVAWCALYGGLIIAAELRERDRRLVIAEGAAHQAQLSALRLQLNPHFLFNTLNMLSGLVAVGRKSLAEEVILNLSQFLRYSLASEGDQLVTLATELEGQRMYLDIERVRFADRLHVIFEVPDECLAACVPSFILQPLVENSIKYAVLPSESEVTLNISARKSRDLLILKVENSAPSPRVGSAAKGLGIGIGNIRKRLEALFTTRASIEASEMGDGGWKNVVQLPWLTECNDDHASSGG